MTRTCVLWMVVSVDGYINGPGEEFIAPAWSADLDTWAKEVAVRFDTLLYGRAAWEGMAGYWPAAESDATMTPAASAAPAQTSVAGAASVPTAADAPQPKRRLSDQIRRAVMSKDDG